MRTSAAPCADTACAIAHAIDRLLAEGGGGGLPTAALSAIESVQHAPELSNALKELSDKQAQLRALSYHYSEAYPPVQRLAAEITELQQRTIPTLARALSSLSLGLAMGGIFVPVIGWSLMHFGWRSTAFASGVVALVLGLPLAMVIRRRPEDIGETVDGTPPPPASATAVEDAAGTRDFTAREALRTPAFWLLSLGHGFALFVVGAVNVHAIAHMKEALGYTVGAAALVIMLVTLFQIGGVMIGWLIGDLYEKRLIAAACMLMHGLGLLSLTYANSAVWIVLFAALHGIAWGLRGPFMHAIRADYFGRSAIGMILGLSFMIIVIGQVGGPMIAGVMADVTGTYRAGFTLLALLACLGSMFFVLAKRPTPPLRSEP